ncbi:MAG: PKD-like family lipoprotein, partial [Odoribacter sp.]
MNKLYKSLLGIWVLVIFLSSCYDDLGSYNYKEINDIEVKLPSVVKVTLPIAGAVPCELKPEIKRSQSGGEENLSFLWRKEVNTGRGMAWQIFSKERNYKIWVKASDVEQVRVRFEVIDTVTHISACQNVEIRKVLPFSAVWFVLQEVNGKAVLGSADVSGEKVIIDKDIRRTLLGGAVDQAPESVEGTPRFILGYPNYSESNTPRIPVVEIFTDQGGYMLDGTKLNVKYDYEQLLFTRLNTGIKVKPEFAKADYGEIIINDGTFWHANSDGYSVFYPVKLDKEVGETYRATHAVASYRRGGAVVYDAQNKCFLYYDNRRLDLDKNTAMRIRGGNYGLYNVDDPALTQLTLLGNLFSYPNKFDPNHIDVDEMLYMGTNISNDFDPSTKAIAIGRKGEMLKIYEISFDGYYAKKSAICPAYSEFKPEGISNSWSLAASAKYDRTFFYASGNKIYRVDLNRKIPKQFLIYTHPEAGVQFSCLKFRSERICTMELVDDENFISDKQSSDLGVAVTYPDGKYGVLELRLTDGGLLANEENGKVAVNEYK